MSRRNSSRRVILAPAVDDDVEFRERLGAILSEEEIDGLVGVGDLDWGEVGDLSTRFFRKNILITFGVGGERAFHAGLRAGIRSLLSEWKEEGVTLALRPGEITPAELRACRAMMAQQGVRAVVVTGDPQHHNSS